MGRKRFFNVFTFLVLTGSSCLFWAGESLAVDRNTITHKFNWGDDLSTTAYTGECPEGTINCTQAPPTQFQSTHLPDIKQAIDLSVTACSITSDVYLQTDREAIAQVGYPGKLVSSTHVNNLRRAIEELYRQKSQTPPAYLSGDVTTGTPILKAHINDMRRALDDLVVSCSGVTETPGACGDTGWMGLNCMSGDVIIDSCLPGQRGYFTTTPRRMCCPMNPLCNEDYFMSCRADASCGAGAVCGNSVVETGEQCDDSNTVNGDGCSSTCQTETACCPGQTWHDEYGFCYAGIFPGYNAAGKCSASPPPPGCSWIMSGMAGIQDDGNCYVTCPCSASYCWENGGGPTECVDHGVCSPEGALKYTKCRELNGSGDRYVMTAYTVQCNDAQSATCTTPVGGGSLWQRHR